MIRIVPQIMMIAISIGCVSQMNAYCAKCVKIEEERAKEQAAHPQPERYYDDIAYNSSTQLPMNQASATTSDVYSTIFTIFKTKNFIETLNDHFTLFIPTNAALMQLPRETLISFMHMGGEEKLAAFVSNHLIARRLLPDDFSNQDNVEIKAISGKNLKATFKNGKLYVNDAQVLRIEPEGKNGVIYLIDKVLTQ